MTTTESNQAEEKVLRFIDQALDLLSNNKNQEAFNILIEAKKLRVSVENLDYVRGLCFIAMNRLEEARQALHEELYHFPNNAPASELLQRTLEEQKASKKPSNIEDQEFHEILSQIRPYSMLPEERLFRIFALAKQVCPSPIQGNFVECGVAGGGSSGMLALLIKRHSSAQRHLFSCDSFSGMPDPTSQDTIAGGDANSTGWGAGTCAAPESSLLEIAGKLGVSELVTPVKGFFCDTLPQAKNKIGAIAFLHIDCDWYQSTLDILDNLYGQLSPGAVVVIDDYGYWEGVKQAFDEFKAKHGLTLNIQEFGDSAWFQKI